MTTQQAVFLVIAAAIALFLIARSRKARANNAPVPANIMDPQAWEIGPVYPDGERQSVGVPLHPTPHPDGWSIRIPEPTADAGHVHYVTVPTGPLTGATLVRLRCRLEADPGVRMVPLKDAAAPALLTLYFQRQGDDWSGRGRYEAYRWFASFATVELKAGAFFMLVARFDQNWTAVETSSRLMNPEAFNDARANAGRIGFVLGGGDGLGHGVYASGPARLVVMDFKVE